MNNDQLAAYHAAKAHEAQFDANRIALANACKRDRESGMSLKKIAEKLNSQGILTKTGREWTGANVCILLQRPEPPVKPITKKDLAREKRTNRKKGVSKRNDPELKWVAESYPQLEKWRELAVQWLKSLETGLSHCIMSMNAFMEAFAKHNLPTNPPEFLLNKFSSINFYELVWGSKKTHGKVLNHNHVHFFIEWVLIQRQFCEEDDDGNLITSPAFRNPIPHLSRSGLPKHYESVRSTLPYGYIEELRQMIAQGPNFRDWKWAQNALGMPSSKAVEEMWQTGATKANEVDEDEANKIGPIWFQVDPNLIDKNDPDCVWRTRTRLIEKPWVDGAWKERETIYEMWSPVRWVALLIKLQLPLRTFQVRMLDSGEADTWRWEDGEWIKNKSPLAKGSQASPYFNGIFIRPNDLVDEDATVLLHINSRPRERRKSEGL